MSSKAISAHRRCRLTPLRFHQTWAQFCELFVPDPGPGPRLASSESKRRNALLAFGEWLKVNGERDSSMGHVLTTPSLLRAYLKESTQSENEMTQRSVFLFFYFSLFFKVSKTTTKTFQGGAEKSR
jgi:hypothetical protein